jgi:hypothetical protein
MSLYKIKREIFRICKDLFIACPVPIKIKFSCLKYWKENYCMREGFNADLPMPRPVSDVANVLDLSCTSGYGQTVHPDVLYVGKREFNGWKYLMTITGYPFSNDYYENPEFLVSMDGLHWELPEDGKSPVVGFPWHIDYSYNSDPALLYHDGKVYMVYRQILKTGRHISVSLYLISSSNGVEWSAPVKIAEKKTDLKPTILLSPSLLALGDSYVMWYVEADEDMFSVYRTESRDLVKWDESNVVTLKGLTGKFPWHIDVVEDGCRLVMAFCTTEDEHEIMFAESYDEGNNWSILGKSIDPHKYGLGGGCLYKPSLCRSEDGELRLYYSAQTIDAAWFTAVTNIKL